MCLSDCQPALLPAGLKGLGHVVTLYIEVTYFQNYIILSNFVIYSNT